MTILLRELKMNYFKFLPCLVSFKEDSEPLQYPVFTYGDLKQVVDSFQHAQSLIEKRDSEKKA